MVSPVDQVADYCSPIFHGASMVDKDFLVFLCLLGHILVVYQVDTTELGYKELLDLA